MHLTKVHLFAILLLALVFCSFFSDICSGSSLEGFNSNSNSNSPYNGKGQYSDQYSNYKNMHSANNARRSKDKPMDPSDNNDDDGSGSSRSYAPYNSGASSGAGGKQGIPSSQIPPGQDDLYILKSEIVPPVCPVCPAMKCDASSSGGEKKCPPCPPCARCPEPAFECKKVPNYNSNNESAFPHPVLNSFSQFGM